MALLTREFPPEVYGGAGVHVEHLTRALAGLVDVDVHCFGAPRPGARGVDAARVQAHEPWPALDGPVLPTLSVDLRLAAAVDGADVVHSHTWYANLGGHLAKLLHGIPHVLTSHSLEPLRPWKAEQLGSGGYEVSLFCERTAVEAADGVVAVSAAQRDDVLRTYPAVDPARVVVIHNGIDPDAYRRVEDADAVERLGVDPARPSVIFLGRVTRQKGVDHALAAAESIDPHAQVVFCAGAPDTPAIGEEMRGRAAELARTRGRVVWIERMLPRPELVQLLSHSSVFLCPSRYEPFGLINLEAMACELPVVATAVGGIPEIVVDGETGYLVRFEEPAGFARELAARVNDLLADPPKARAFGRAGRARVLERFAWPAVAARTVALYERVTGTSPS